MLRSYKNYIVESSFQAGNPIIIIYVRERALVTISETFKVVKYKNSTFTTYSHTKMNCPGVLDKKFGNMIQRTSSGELCPEDLDPGNFVRGTLSGELCPGNFVRGALSGELCPGNFILNLPENLISETLTPIPR